MGASKLLALFALTGCDLVFGVDGEETPCTLGDYAQAVDLVAAEAFTFDWDESFGVVQASDGLPYEIDRDGVVAGPIDLGSYLSVSLALAPEGNALFYTVIAEPMLLKGALRGEAMQYTLQAGVPRGTFAGTPSADVFGPRRVLVKLRPGLDDASIQEYEDNGAAWIAVGEPRAIATERAPNLTPDGLTMVYAGSSDAGEPAVFAAQRSSRNAAFGEPVRILDGAFTQVQLCGRCARLYATDGVMLRRYE